MSIHAPGWKRHIRIDDLIPDIGSLRRGIWVIHAKFDLHRKAFPKKVILYIYGGDFVDYIRILFAAVKAGQQDIVMEMMWVFL